MKEKIYFTSEKLVFNCLPSPFNSLKETILLLRKQCAAPFRGLRGVRWELENAKILSYKFFLITYLFVFILAFGSCTKYLEVDPDSRVEPSDVEDFQAIITGAYPGAVHLFTEVMSDNYQYYDYKDFNSATIVSWFKPMYLWSDNYSQNLPVGPEQAWDTYYHSIYLSNVVIEGIDEAGGEEGHKNSVKGEAYLLRAYCHFMLVNLFAKHFDPNTASNDKGIPYALKTETGKKVDYKRESVAYVYKKIEEDILKGIELVDDMYMDQVSYHFNKAAAYAFLSRYYLFKGEYKKCVNYSTQALSINNSVRHFIEDYNTFFAENDFEGFAKDYCTTEKENILLMGKVLEWNSYYRTGFYANEFTNMFPSYDFRGKIYVFNDNSYPNWHVQKFISQYKEGQQYSNVALFTVEEVLLNRAEARLLSESNDMAGAVTDLNSILKYRHEGFEPLKVADFEGYEYHPLVMILEYLINQRRFELCFEGYRWFDLKRYGMTIVHRSETGDVVLEGDDPRYVLQIPEKELSANELMVPNPR